MFLILASGGFLYFADYFWAEPRPTPSDADTPSQSTLQQTPDAEANPILSTVSLPPAAGPSARMPEPAPLATSPVPDLRETGPQAALQHTSTPAPLPNQHPSSAEIAALVIRGDGFLGARDITSARLFYERAADAGNASAALRLGATFDPGFLSRAGIREILGDATQAAFWYRRARDLGDPATVSRLEDLRHQPAGEQNQSPH
jgi:hypothetical protein